MNEKYKNSLFAKFSIAPLAELPLSAKIVWGFIFENGEGKYPHRELAEKLGVAVASVTNSLEMLENAHLITFSERRVKSTPKIKAILPDGAARMF